jgi:hypothetical protein
MRRGGIARAGLGATGAIPRLVERAAAISDRRADAVADRDCDSAYCRSTVASASASESSPGAGAGADSGRGRGRGGQCRGRLGPRVGAGLGLLDRNRAGRDLERRAGDRRRPRPRGDCVCVRGALFRTSRPHGRRGRGRRRGRNRVDRERAARPARSVVDSRRGDRWRARTLVLTAATRTSSRDVSCSRRAGRVNRAHGPKRGIARARGSVDH